MMLHEPGNEHCGVNLKADVATDKGNISPSPLFVEPPHGGDKALFSCRHSCSET